MGLYSGLEYAAMRGSAAGVSQIKKLYAKYTYSSYSCVIRRISSCNP